MRELILSAIGALAGALLLSTLVILLLVPDHKLLDKWSDARNWIYSEMEQSTLARAD